VDIIVMIWILSTLSPELHEIVREPTETARQAWRVIEAKFLGSREARDRVAKFLGNCKFRIFMQCDLSVSDYCRWMKGMADDLHALSQTVIDHHLVLNLIQGMYKRFNHMKIFIKRLQSFPSFNIIRNDLELEEIELDNSAAHGHASVFYSMSSGGGCPSQQLLPPRPPQQEPLCLPTAPPPPAPTPTMAIKARVRVREKGKVRITAPTTLATTSGAPQHVPLSTIPRPTSSRCG
jgi:hypothetical protein